MLTGTVLSGGVKVGDTVELPALGMDKKIKSMQSFKRPVESAMQGDRSDCEARLCCACDACVHCLLWRLHRRVALCVTQLDSSLLERGLVCTPGSRK